MRSTQHYNYNGNSFGGYVDEYDNPVCKTKHTHPYSYDGYVQWRGGKNEEITGSVWSDRMSQWDYAKNKMLKEKHFNSIGDNFDARQPKDIEAYLNDYFGHPVKLILVMQYCNVILQCK